ncbi:DEAD/DEAH box helicase [Saxibacter everestensis]|uniref:ATP-dependent RNA helicase DeaD n=1 Tax=Saxibacter everestensis TaxID=2909229 RepID=A0ABY8QYC4_9MICO|nr:DEAD/DEAH box helicase [Brevibacteriaceae bacterium ZFBP1038]
MSDTPTSTETERAPFSELGINEKVLRALSDVGYETPTPIQAVTIPPLLEGRDVVGLAQTGTGKTAAFAVPVLSHLAERGHHGKAPAALVLAPTRELALQVAEAFASYATHLPGFTVLPVYGGQSYGPQLAGLRRGAQVVVGTPGRVIDHLKKGTMDLSQLEYLVLDEADEMLRMGFQQDVEEILATTPDSKQVALFSATMPSSIRKIASKYLNDPREITVKSKTTTGANTRQRFLSVMHSHKLDALTRILEVEEYDGIIMFVRTKSATEDLADKLRARGYTAAAINGDIPQQARERTINQLRDGQIDILVATDVAARGLDVERISLVVNYDIPHDTESYVHRIGRTGRAGRTGDAILFVTPREKHLLRSIERATRQPVSPLEMPSVEDVNASRAERFAARITEALSSEDLSTVRSVVEEYERTHDVPATEIAAALAAMVLDGQSLSVEPLPEPGSRSKGVGAGRPGSRGDRRPAGNRTTYRLDVGRAHRVQPGAIVGAIANEGGINSSDIGHIDIRSDHSLVELPSELPDSTWQALKRTRVAGELIRLRRDSGRPGRPEHGGRRDDSGRRDFGGRDRDESRGGDREYRGGKSSDGPGRKPRHKVAGRKTY